MTRLIAIALCFLTFATFAPAPAHAEESDLPEMMTYDPTHTGNANQAAESMRDMQRQSQVDKGYTRPDTVHVGIVHYPYMSDDQFGIQMSVPDMISGCYTFTPLEYEAKFTEPYFLNIEVKRYRRIAPEGVNSKCDRQNKMASAMMVLSKNDLKARGTREIKFSTEVATDTYKVVLDDDHIELIPTSMVIFKAQNLAGPVKDRIIYSFAGDKMIALQVPMARPNEDLTPQMINFGRTLGLVPATNGNPAAWDGNGRATYYFLDQSGRTSSRIGEDGYAEIGTVTANRPYDGQDGRTETAVDLSVFVTRPGTQL